MSALPTVTAKIFRSWNPCWDNSKLDAFLDQYEDEPWTALDVLSLRGIPAEDLLWVVLRPEFLPKSVRHEFGFWCADRARLSAAQAMEDAGLPDQARLLRKLAPVTGATSADAAGDAARTAWAAARDARHAARAAWAAASAAGSAWAAARTAWAAASAAGYAASAAEDAAGAAEREQQVRKLCQLLKVAK